MFIPRIFLFSANMCFSTCTVCSDSPTSENKIIKCICCQMAVHVYCYGIQEVNKDWKCSPCSEIGERGVAFCVFCKKSNGAIKKTKCGKWIHVVCALFTSKVNFVNHATMEPVDISNVHKSYKTCYFCKKGAFVTIKCWKRGCNNRFHVTCAQENKTLKEYINKDDSIKFTGYCSEHKKSDRRLSGEIIKVALKNKKQNDAIQAESSRSNSAWILDQLQNNFDDTDHLVPRIATTVSETCRKFLI